MEKLTQIIEDPELVKKILLSKNQLQIALDSLNDYICLLDSDFNILRVNKSYADYLESPIKSLLGKKCYKAFWNLNAPCLKCPAAAATSKMSPVINQEMKKHIKEKEYFFSVSAFPAVNTDRGTIIIEHIRDITRKKQEKEQEARSEMLSAIGIMTAGIAHEINNPLTGICGTVENMTMMPDKYGLNSQGIERLNLVLEQAEKAGKIIKDLTRLSQKHDRIRIPTDVRPLIKEIVKKEMANRKTDMDISFDFGKSLPLIQCDPSEIKQIIKNIISNSIHGISDKIIKNVSDNDYRGRISIGIDLYNGEADNYIRLKIADNGTGIPDNIKDKIFEPFFTTRQTPEASGLGLSICQRIIDKHHGRISIGSRNGYTEALIYLPVSSYGI